MIGALSALVTILAWGTWLAPSQNVSFRSQQVKTFYVAAANLVLAVVVALLQGGAAPSLAGLGLPFAGGLIWSVSGLCAFTATEKLGIARAFGIWAPLNIIVSIIWGAVLFGEFLHLDSLNLTIFLGSLALILTGVLMIIFSKGEREKQRTRHDMLVGVLGAVGAGVLWATYYIPIKISESSMWISSLPLAVGIFCGSLLLVLFSRLPLRLYAGRDYVRVSVTGLLWGIGNYGMLVLVEQLGAGRGFTLSQLSVVVNAMVGIFWLRDPAPRTRAAWLTLAGCILATVGGIFLGNLK